MSPPETPAKPRKWVTRQLEIRLREDRRSQRRSAGEERRAPAARPPRTGGTPAATAAGSEPAKPVRPAPAAKTARPAGGRKAPGRSNPRRDA